MTCEVKFVELTYYATSVFMIPKNWENDDYGFKWDKLYHKSSDKEINLQIREAECDYKRPSEIVVLEDEEAYSSEEYFECEGSDSTAVLEARAEIETSEAEHAAFITKLREGMTNLT